MRRSLKTAVQILDEDGTPTMPFATLLVSYLQNRDRSKAFRLGEWLSTVSERELASLLTLAERQVSQPTTDPDLLGVYFFALAAERGQRTVSLKMDEVEQHAVKMLALFSVEDLRRRGQVELAEILSVEYFDQCAILLTELGLQEAKIAQ